MITKIFNTTTVADGSTERLIVHTKIEDMKCAYDYFVEKHFNNN